VAAALAPPASGNDVIGRKVRSRNDRNARRVGNIWILVHWARLTTARPQSSLSSRERLANEISGLMRTSTNIVAFGLVNRSVSDPGPQGVRALLASASSSFSSSLFRRRREVLSRACVYYQFCATKRRSVFSALACATSFVRRSNAQLYVGRISSILRHALLQSQSHCDSSFVRHRKLNASSITSAHTAGYPTTSAYDLADGLETEVAA
jgi:hypothetical protein